MRKRATNGKVVVVTNKKPMEAQMQYITEGNDGFMFDVGSLYHWLEGLADLRHRRGKRYPLPVALSSVYGSIANPGQQMRP